LARIAGSTKGYKHRPPLRGGLKRSGILNPMYGRVKSKEFLDMARSAIGIKVVRIIPYTVLKKLLLH
jgi:hypothetical protein